MVENTLCMDEEDREEIDHEVFFTECSNFMLRESRSILHILCHRRTNGTNRN